MTCSLLCWQAKRLSQSFRGKPTVKNGVEADETSWRWFSFALELRRQAPVKLFRKSNHGVCQNCGYRFQSLVLTAVMPVQLWNRSLNGLDHYLLHVNVERVPSLQCCRCLCCYLFCVVIVAVIIVIQAQEAKQWRNKRWSTLASFTCHQQLAVSFHSSSPLLLSLLSWDLLWERALPASMPFS